MEDARLLVPRDKADFERLNALIAIGYPANAFALPGLFEWTADGNWPIAEAAARYLFGLRLPAIDLLMVALRGDDGAAKWHRINLVIHAMPAAIACDLMDELDRLTNDPSPDDRREEVPEIAREALDWIASSAPHSL